MNASISRRQLAIVVAERLIAEPARRQALMQQLAAYLVEHNRVNETGALLNDIAHELAGQSGQLSLEVESAQKLAASTLAEVTTFIKQQTGAAHVNVHQTVESELLGGFIARTPDAELNASVQHNLRKLAAIT